MVRALADRFLVKGLTAEVPKIMKVDVSCPTPDIIEFAYDNLPEDHEFLSHLANCFVIHRLNSGKEELDIKKIENLPILFLCQVIAKGTGNTSKLVRDFRNYPSGTWEDDLY